MDKATGRGETRDQKKMTKQSGRVGEIARRQKGSQGRGGRGERGIPWTPPRTYRRSARLVDQEEKTREQMTVEKEEQATNPFAILQMDEEEELEDEEMQEILEEMQAASPSHSPRRPAIKRTEREEASVGSMRRPSIRGKHEEKGVTFAVEGGKEETMEEAKERTEENMDEGETQVVKEEVKSDDFRYANRSKHDKKESSPQGGNEEEDTNMVEDDKSSYWGGEREEEVEAQGKTTEDDQFGTHEEEEGSELAPEEEARAMKRALIMEQERELEGKDMKVESKRRINSAEQENKEEGKLNNRRNVEASGDKRQNPYRRGTTKKGDEAREESGGEEEFTTPMKDNKTKSKGGKTKEQESAGAKAGNDSEEESVVTIPQSNTKSNMIQSPRIDLRHAVEGLKLPIFRGTLPRKFLYRYDLKLQVPSSEDAVAALIQAAKAFWAQMVETDKTAVLAPYAQEHQNDNPLLSNMAKFPTTLSALKKYFARAQPNTKGQTLYVSILMAHNIPYEEIMENIRWWLGEKKFGLWKRQVQSETVKTIGYLLYSTRALEPEYMKELVEKAVNRHKKARKFGRKLELGFRWRVIPMGKQGKIKEEDQVRAMHIECPTEQFQVVKSILAEMYAADAQDFPGGMKFRLVPDIYGMANPETRAKVLHLRARQATFLKKVMVMTSYEIASLDHRFVDEEGYEGSIRDRLMWIPSKERDYLSQFVSVTSQYNGTGVVFSFIPQLESEARSLIASLIPLFKYEYGEGIKKFFKPDAWEMHEETVWDPDLRVAVTPDDKRVDDIAEQDPEYQWLEEEAVVELKNVPKRPDPKEKSLYGDDGGDSVSTFRTMKEQLEEVPQWKTPTATGGTGRAVTPVAFTHQEDTSSMTSTLDGTVESRISSLESAAEQTNRMLHDMMKMMQSFTKLEKSKERKNQSEVTMTVDQYEFNKPPHGEKEE
jgi:hypothetical protein